MLMIVSIGFILNMYLNYDADGRASLLLTDWRMPRLVPHVVSVDIKRVYHVWCIGSARTTRRTNIMTNVQPPISIRGHVFLVCMWSRTLDQLH